MFFSFDLLLIAMVFAVFSQPCNRRVMLCPLDFYSTCEATGAFYLSEVEYLVIESVKVGLSYLLIWPS